VRNNWERVYDGDILNGRHAAKQSDLKNGFYIAAGSIFIDFTHLMGTNVNNSDNIVTVKKNTEMLIDASKEICL
jgi:hypothetical protein